MIRRRNSCLALLLLLALLLVLGGVLLVCRLAGLETFGVPYLTPFASAPGEQKERHTVLRQPLRKTKLREGYLRPRNRRNQG